jgi:hypothetical protein
MPAFVEINYADFAFRDGSLRNYTRNVLLSPRVFGQLLRSQWGDLRNKGDLSNEKILYGAQTVGNSSKPQ